MGIAAGGEPPPGHRCLGDTTARARGRAAVRARSRAVGTGSTVVAPRHTASSARQDPTEKPSCGCISRQSYAGGIHQSRGLVGGRPVVADGIGSRLHGLVEQVCKQRLEQPRRDLDPVVRISDRKVLEAVPLRSEHLAMTPASEGVRDAFSTSVRLLISCDPFRRQDHQSQIVLHRRLSSQHARKQRWESRSGTT